MTQIKIDLVGLNANVIDVKENGGRLYFMIEDYEAILPPHYQAKNLLELQDVLTFFIDKAGDLGVAVVAYFLCDLIQKKKVKNVRINNKEVITENEIKDALNNE
jgi:hypothetical protein